MRHADFREHLFLFFYSQSTDRKNFIYALNNNTYKELRTTETKKKKHEHQQA